MSDIQSPAVRFPPPLLYLGMILLGWLLGYLLPLPTIALSPRLLKGVGGLFILIGIAINILGFLQFKKNKEDVIPWTGSEQMIAEGIYKITRNPMYVGMSAIALGIGIYFASYAMITTAVIASLIIDRFVIIREEAYLETRFGESYANYKKRVRRWI